MNLIMKIDEDGISLKVVSILLVMMTQDNSLIWESCMRGGWLIETLAIGRVGWCEVHVGVNSSVFDRTFPHFYQLKDTQIKTQLPPLC